MPVMVFIHGHSYDTGTGNAYDGSVLSSFGDVIVVTLNYRLGVLGFLTTLDQSAMGNLGLLDITQALLWLQDNIASFSGDPKRVTLFGHGHGAALVNLLLLSPFVSEGRGPFFQQAIIQSGAALSTWAVSYDPVWCTQKLAINVNCSAHIGDTSGLVNCLRRRTVAELINGAPEPPKYYSCFAPAVDEWTFLPTQPEKLMKERNSKFASVPVMFGITKNEAYAYLKQQEIHKGLSDFRKTQIIRTYVQNVYRYHRQKIYEILDHKYTDWTKPADHMSNRDNILELLSDGQYVAPLIKTANYHAQTADTYLYTFSHSTQSETDADHGPEEEIQGIHGDELPYVFGSPLVDGVSPFPSTYTAAEKMLSEAVMTYWTNFAKSGNPNFPRNQSSVHGGKVNNRFVGLTWPKYDKDKQEYLQISRRPAVRHHYRSENLALWLDLIPKINVLDGSDPSSHLLTNFNNQSTFDDYHRLLPPFDNVFPSPPPMPPISPTITHPPTFVERLSTSDFGHSSKTQGADGAGSHPRHNMGSHSRPDVVTADVAENGVSSANEAVSTLPASKSQGPEGAGQGHWTGPLSITVAVGCTLLFLNILIFGAMYYQRYHIRKMRLSGAAGSELATDGSGHHDHNQLDDPDDIKLSRKIEREATRNCIGGGPVIMGPETDSLLSAGTGGGGSVVGVGEGASFLARAEESPSRDLGISSSSTLGRRTPPTSVTTAGGGAMGNGKKAGAVLGGKLSRGPSIDSSYTYTAVPTHTASPLHRPQIHVLPHSHQSHNPTPSTLPHPYVPHSQPHPPPLVMNTFANSISSLGRGPRYSVPPVKAVASSTAADTGLYQVINKGSVNTSANTSERGGASSSTNAITIV